ncbi:MAG: heavy-metal-associated domain-containing protein [Phycisphaerales bacterium]
MRFTHFARFAVLVSSLALAGCASSTESASPAEARADAADFSGDFRPIEADSATLVVRGLSCPKCANNVNLQLEKVAGIGETHIDMGAGEVRVEFSQLAARNPSKAQLAKAITDAGFTVVDIRTP